MHNEVLFTCRQGSLFVVPPQRVRIEDVPFISGFIASYCVAILTPHKLDFPFMENM